MYAIRSYYGLGSVYLRRRGEEIVFEKGDRFSLEVLRGGTVGEGIREKISQPEAAKLTPGSEGESFWDRIHGIEETFRVGLEKRDSKKTTNALLELDRAIWKGKQDLDRITSYNVCYTKLLRSRPSWWETSTVGMKTST